jgi:hypothetical protein
MRVAEPDPGDPAARHLAEVPIHSDLDLGGSRTGHPGVPALSAAISPFPVCVSREPRPLERASEPQSACGIDQLGQIVLRGVVDGAGDGRDQDI